MQRRSARSRYSTQSNLDGSQSRALRDRVRRPSRLIGLTSLVTIAIVAASPALAQRQSANIVEALTDVNAGSGAAQVGCGGAGGGNALIATLNASLGQNIDDSGGIGIASRRAAFRFCDSQTNQSGIGWTNGGANGIATLDAQAASAQSLAPEEVFASMDNANASFDMQTANVSRRLSMLRLARLNQLRATPEQIASRVRGLDVESTDGDRLDGRGPAEFDENVRAERLLLALQNGINAGDGTNGSGLGYFLNGRVHIVKGEENEAESGSEGTGGGFTLGVDQQLGDAGYAGVALGYTRIATTYDGSASESDLDAVTVSFYGAWYPKENFYVDGSLSTAWLGIDTTNEILIFDNGPVVPDLKGSTDGVNVGIDLGIGYNIAIEQIAGLSIEPLARVNVLYTEIDNFEQKGGDNSLNLKIGEQDTTSVTGTFGFRTDYAISTSLGVVTPYVRAAYVHEFNQENDDVTASIAALPGANFKLKANSTDSHYGNFGVGLAATFGQGFSQYVDYDVVGGHDNVTLHQITAGLRFEY